MGRTKGSLPTVSKTAMRVPCPRMLRLCSKWACVSFLVKRASNGNVRIWGAWGQSAREFQTELQKPTDDGDDDCWYGGKDWNALKCEVVKVLKRLMGERIRLRRIDWTSSSLHDYDCCRGKRMYSLPDASQGK